MHRSRLSTVSAGIFIILSVSGARSSDFGNALSFGNAQESAWIVTLGGYGGAQSSFPGARSDTFVFYPIASIQRAGEREWLTLPTDAFSFSLYTTGDFRFGAAADYILNRSHRNDSALNGLPGINYTWQGGAFADYYPLPFLRTRVELLQGISGADGFNANLMADYIYAPDPAWLFTIGPKLQFVDTQYVSAFFSIDSAESGPSGLPPYHASGGLYSAGINASARYNLTEQFSLRAFAEWDRLLGSAADSPLVRLRGSEDQYQFGLGAAYRFSYSW